MIDFGKYLSESLNDEESREGDLLAKWIPNTPKNIRKYILTPASHIIRDAWDERAKNIVRKVGSLICMEEETLRFRISPSHQPAPQDERKFFSTLTTENDLLRMTGEIKEAHRITFDEEEGLSKNPEFLGACDAWGAQYPGAPLNGFDYEESGVGVETNHGERYYGTYAYIYYGCDAVILSPLYKLDRYFSPSQANKCVEEIVREFDKTLREDEFDARSLAEFKDETRSVIRGGLTQLEGLLRRFI